MINRNDPTYTDSKNYFESIASDDYVKQDFKKIYPSFDGSYDFPFIRIPCKDRTYWGIEMNLDKITKDPNSFIISYNESYYFFNSSNDKALGVVTALYDPDILGVRTAYAVKKIRFHERFFKIKGSRLDYGLWIKSKSMEKPFYVRNWKDVKKVINKFS